MGVDLWKSFFLFNCSCSDCEEFSLRRKITWGIGLPLECGDGSVTCWLQIACSLFCFSHCSNFLKFAVSSERFSGNSRRSRFTSRDGGGRCSALCTARLVLARDPAEVESGSFFFTRMVSRRLTSHTTRF